MKLSGQKLVDKRAREAFSANVKRCLKSRDKSVNWLHEQTGINLNRLYPAVAGDTNVSAGVVVSVAHALEVSIDTLLPVDLIVTVEPSG